MTWSRKSDGTTPAPLPSPPADKRGERKRRGQAGPHQAPPPSCAAARCSPSPARAARRWRPPATSPPAPSSSRRHGHPDPGSRETRPRPPPGAAHLRQPEENAGGLDELAAQDAQVRLAGQVQAVLHGRGRRQPLLRDQ